MTNKVLLIDKSDVLDKNEKLKKNVIINLYKIYKYLNYKIICTDNKIKYLLSNQGIKTSTTIPKNIDELQIYHTKNSTVKNGIKIKLTEWDNIFNWLKNNSRKIVYSRETNETKIHIKINPDGTGKYLINTGLGFLNHMLELFAKHSSTDLEIKCQGDLNVDEHHTVEDIAIALGEAYKQILKDKKYINRYGYCLPMDDSIATVAIDLSGRSYLLWNVEFKRERIGDVPTELFEHFFRSFADSLKCNIYINAKGYNEHHKIEAIFKSFARAIKEAVKQDFRNESLPTTKGLL